MSTSLLDLNAEDLKQILRIRLQQEAYEKRIADILARARARPKPKNEPHFPWRQQPRLREVIGKCLRKSSRPLSVVEIYEATLATGYHWRSKDPLNALNVKMYTDRTFKKVSPGHFSMRNP